MPDLPKKQKPFELVTQSIRDSGWNVLILPATADHSLRLKAYKDDENYTIRVYIWRITPGGKNRSANEYRIQITGVSQFQPEPNGKTLILGWWAEGGVFAGFDLRKHASTLGASPSFQIAEQALRQASTNGFAPYDKGNDEIAIAFRPDFIIEYIRQIGQLHDFGESEETFEVLKNTASDPSAVNDDVLSSLNEPRRIALRSVRTRVRDAKFQTQVLGAYKYHCALCGIQLDLVEGAHIVPVGDERSVDEVYNGMALCVLHHRAYDRALVTIDIQDGGYRVLFNKQEAKRLAEIGHDGGLDPFISALASSLYLPENASLRPHADYVNMANELRGWNILDKAEIQVL